MTIKKTYIITLLFLFILTGCEKEKESSDLLNHSIIYDKNGKVLIELTPDFEISEIYNDYLIETIKQTKLKFGLNPLDDVLEVYTNIDSKIQKILVENFGSESAAGFIIKENNTGHVIAMTNGKTKENSEETIFDYRFFENFILTPIVTYSPSFEHLSLSTADYTLDEPYVHPGTDFIATNRDGQYLGVIPVKEAFTQKRISTLYINDELIKVIGYERHQDYLRSWTETQDEYYFIGNGGATLASVQSDLKNISNGYQMILNGGEYIESQYVNKITIHSNNGESRQATATFRKEDSISKEAAYLTTRLLQHSFMHLKDFDILSNHFDDLQLFGYSDYALYDKSKHSLKMTDPSYIYAIALGNVDFSITGVVLNQNKEDYNSTTLTVMNLMRTLFEELNQSYTLSNDFDKPLGIKESNYLPRKVNDNGLDSHEDNSTSELNYGMMK